MPPENGFYRKLAAHRTDRQCVVVRRLFGPMPFERAHVQVSVLIGEQPSIAATFLP
jgi:hypothetical protein